MSELDLGTWLSEQGYSAEDLEALGPQGLTPLMQASRLGNLPRVEQLLGAGARLDTATLDGNQALWLACFSENAEIIDCLIRAGALLDHGNAQGSTTLMYAASSGKTSVVEQLLKAGARADLRNDDGFSALDLAANLECLGLLRGR